MVFNMSILLLLCSLATVSAVKSYKGKDCGKADAPVTFIDIEITPNPITYPGKISVSVKMNMSKTLPDDVQLGLRLIKEPKMAIPCLFKVFGSCDYDVCHLVKVDAEHFCPFFPQGVECKCPLKPGLYGHEMEKVNVDLPNLGAALGSILQGKYHGKFILFSKKTPNEELGCGVFPTFEIKNT